jgi:hypothetical protein
MSMGIKLAMETHRKITIWVVVFCAISLLAIWCFGFGRKAPEPDQTAGQVIAEAEAKHSGFAEGWNRAQAKERQDVEALLTQYRDQCATAGSYQTDPFDADTCRCVLDFALKNLRDRSMPPPEIPEGY